MPRWILRKNRLIGYLYDQLRKNREEWLNLKQPHLIRDLLERAWCGASSFMQDGKNVVESFHV